MIARIIPIAFAAVALVLAFVADRRALRRSTGARKRVSRSA
jgi:hypothetical protein